MHVGPAVGGWSMLCKLPAMKRTAYEGVIKAGRGLAEDGCCMWSVGCGLLATVQRARATQPHRGLHTTGQMVIFLADVINKSCLLEPITNFTISDAGEVIENQCHSSGDAATCAAGADAAHGTVDLLRYSDHMHRWQQTSNVKQ